MITLQVINDLIYDLHDINLKATFVKHPPSELSMFRRCFVNLARRYTDESLNNIAKFVNIGGSSVGASRYINTYNKIGEDLKFANIYRDLNLKLNAIKAGKASVDVIMERIDRLEKEISELKETVKLLLLN